jgi:anti-sigma factor RsiW
MNTCERYEEAMSAYIDGELDDATGADLFAHLGTCTTCRQSFTAMSAIRTRFAAAPAPEVPERLDRRIHRLHAAPAARVSRLRTVWTQRFTIPAPAFALALLIASVTILASVLWLRTTPAPAGEQQVMYIMSMPAVEVEGVPNHPSSHVQ